MPLRLAAGYVTGKKKGEHKLVKISLAIVPHANLVKVIETQASSYRVEQFGIAHGDGDNLGDIELEEVQVPEYGDIMCVTNKDED